MVLIFPTNQQLGKSRAGIVKMGTLLIFNQYEHLINISENAHFLQYCMYTK